MAGRRKQPVDVVIAKGRKHLTKAEIEKRRAEEEKLKVPFTKIEVPSCLDEYPNVAIEFEKYARMLSAIGDGKLFTELDVDCLTRYVLGHAMYLRYTGLLIEESDPNVIKTYLSAQSKAFMQAHQSASVLGLNITSRCKLVVPAPDDGGDGNDEYANI